MKYLKLSSLGLVLFLAVFLGCKRDIIVNQEQAAVPSAPKAPVKTYLDAPVLSCASSTGAAITLNVCAGATGAPAGFSVQWILKSEFDANGGWPSSSDVVNGSSFCKASFSGVPGASQYNLGPNACIAVTIGDVIYDQVGASSPCENVPLQCGKQYVFRAFAHNVPQGLNKSEFSANQICATLSCGNTGCTYSQGFWKTHGPVGCAPGNQTNTWPVTSLMLGSVSYTDLQLCSIFNTPAAGNGLINLAHQLIAAKLNIAHGADGSAIQTSINAADALIGGLVIPPVGSGYLAPAATSSLITALTNYNEGVTGPGHCTD